MALILMAAGGGGGYLLLQKQAIASLGPADQAALERKKASEMDAAEAEEFTKNLRFVELNPIILPIIDAEGVNQVVTLVVSLEVIGEDNAGFVQRLSPRLKDAYIQDMYGVLNRKASMDGGVIKVDELKERLSRISTRVLGGNKVNNVLLQVVNQRAI